MKHCKTILVWHILPIQRNRCDTHLTPTMFLNTSWIFFESVAHIPKSLILCARPAGKLTRCNTVGPHNWLGQDWKQLGKDWNVWKVDLWKVDLMFFAFFECWIFLEVSRPESLAECSLNRLNSEDNNECTIRIHKYHKFFYGHLKSYNFPIIVWAWFRAMDLAKLLNRKSPKKRPASNGPPARKKPALSEPPVEIVDLLGDDLLLASNVKTATHFQYGHPESYLYIYICLFSLYTYILRPPYPLPTTAMELGWPYSINESVGCLMSLQTLYMRWVFLGTKPVPCCGITFHLFTSGNGQLFCCSGQQWFLESLMWWKGFVFCQHNEIKITDCRQTLYFAMSVFC